MDIIRYPAREAWPKLCERPGGAFGALEEAVRDIMNGVREGGDKAVLDFTAKFDGAAPSGLEVTRAELEAAAKLVPDDLKTAVLYACGNVEAFHKAQAEKSRRMEIAPGVVCWRRSVPIERVGLYVPGGTAPLISTVLMLAVPARLAGCREIILCSPPDKDGEIPAIIRWAALELGATRVFRIGGAQAIAAMAYGTESVPRVDKIFGPGNRYVTCAKQLAAARGEVAIDLPAGPSEVLVVADDSCVPAFAAADLLSQAEHGADSQVMLVTPDEKILPAIEKELRAQLAVLPRRAIAERALEASRIVVLSSLQECMDFSNTYAPEHLILSVKNPAACAGLVCAAGSVFLGNYSPEAAGDYASGTNHTLPTCGAARCYSGVSLDSFVNKITFQELTSAGLNALGGAVERMAEAERLEAHRNAVAIRRRGLPTAPSSASGFRLADVLRPHLSGLTPYSSARDEFSGQASIWLDANENPYGTVTGEDCHRYPDPHQRDLRNAIAKLKGTASARVFIGNGSDEIIDLLLRAFCEPGRDKALIMPPTYGMYEAAAGVNAVEIVHVPLKADFSMDPAAALAAAGPDVKLAFICSPNNPSGNCMPPEAVAKFVRNFSGVAVLDEAYMDFAPGKSLLPRLGEFLNLVILQTFSKAWGMAGARIGMAFASEEMVAALDRMKPPYNVSGPAQEAALKAIGMAARKDEIAGKLVLERGRLEGLLRKLPFVVKVFPSDANFLLVKVTDPKRLYADLLKRGIVIRDRSSVYGCAGCVRITVGTRAENDALLSACGEL